MTEVRAVARFLVSAWWLQLKQLSTTRLQMMTALFQPMLFATIAFLVFRHAPGHQTPTEIALGAGLLGMWGSTLFGSGAAITRYRFMGLLEGVVASPMPTPVVILPVTIASATVGLYSMLATFAWGYALFGMPLAVQHPVLFVLCVLANVIALGVMGLLIGSVFFLYPASQALANAVEFPIALLSGILVPVASLPELVRPLSYLVAPMWGVRALHAAAVGAATPTTPLLMCALLTACYLAAATVLLRILVNRARDKAKLALT
ncbi:ABC transporter permease [Kitasatospora sp. HPMI-4]|uniref:ABC transporter permease n=1 Tax=Kitasatospora sp. HPMI-4 TaxID=3448443 RepID=UPI003F1DEEFD